VRNILEKIQTKFW